MSKAAIVFIGGAALLASYVVFTRVEASHLRKQLSKEGQKRKELEAKIAKYLTAEGRACPSEMETCLDEAIARLAASNKNDQPASDLRDRLAKEVQERKELEAKIAKYLITQGRSCPSETEKCLDEAITGLTDLIESGQPNCSLVPDNICPIWCSAGSDYDCCVAKGPKWRWYPGRGCHPSKE